MGGRVSWVSEWVSWVGESMSEWVGILGVLYKCDSAANHVCGLRAFVSLIDWLGFSPSPGLFWQDLAL